MWLEHISRQSEVRQRLHMQEGQSYVIGRAPNCDIVLDDPYVAPEHARLSHSPEGWQLSDLNTLNGIDLARSKVRDIKLEGGEAFSLGQSHFRVRSGAQSVALERRLPTIDRWSQWPWVAVLVVLALLPVLLVKYANQFGEWNPIEWLGTGFAALGILIGWSVFWAVLSRVFVGQPWFSLHLGIATKAALASVIWPWLVSVLAYSFSLPNLQPLGLWGALLIAAWAIIKHCELAFGGIGKWARGAVVVLALMPGLVGILGEQSRRLRWFDNQVITHLPDPSVRMVGTVPSASLIQSMQGLRSEIDRLIVAPDNGEDDD